MTSNFENADEPVSNCFQTYPYGAFPITVRLKVNFTQKGEQALSTHPHADREASEVT